MTATSRCARCGAPLTADSSSCTACLIRLGFEPEADTSAPVTRPDSPAGVPTLGDPTGGGFLQRHLGEYELLEEIGRGGMGIVYRARQARLDRLVAVKVLLVGRFASPESARRFEREARAAARLHHPHIVAIHEFGVADGQAFLSMDCVPGPSLAARIRDGPLLPDQAARYLVAITRAVDYAHTQGILHRDLKPANILLDADDQPQLTDFGLAKHLGEGPDVTLTGQALGSPNYMSPEQAAGRHETVGPAADIYSLGAILYHALTGRPPFLAASVAATLRQVLDTEPLAPRLLAPHLPRDLETLCLKCLDKRPNGRFATARELADELDRFLAGHPIRSRPVGPIERTRRWCCRNPRLAASASGALVLGLLAVVFALSAFAQGIRAGRAERLEREQRHTVERQSEERRQRLGQSYLESGRRLIEAGDPTGALLWYLEAFGLDQGRPEAEAVHRLRIASTRQIAPTLERILRHDHGVQRAALTPDGHRLLTLSGPSPPLGGRPAAPEGKAILWNLDTGEPAWGPLPFHPLRPEGPHFNGIGIRYHPIDAAGRHCFTITASDGTISNVTSEVLVHRLADGTRVGRPLPHQGIVPFAEFSPDGRWIAVGTARRLPDGTARGDASVWEVETGNRVCPLLPHDRSITATRFSPDGRRLLTAGSDGVARVFELPAGRELFRLEHEGPLLNATFDHAGRRIATSGAVPFHVRLWDAETGRPLGKPLPHISFDANVYEVQFSPDDRHLLSFGLDRTARLWDVASVRAALPPTRHTTFVYRARFTPDGWQFVTATLDGSATFWSVEDGSQVGPILPHGIMLNDVLVTPDGQRVITATSGGLVHLWRLPPSLDTTATLRHAGPILHAEYSPDGRSILTASADGTARVWDATDGHPLTAPLAHARRVVHAAFSPDGRRVATASLDGSARLWNVTTGEAASPPLRHPHAVWHAAFDPTGRRLVTAGGAAFWHEATRGDPSIPYDPAFGLVRRNSGEARLWSVDSGREIASPIHHPGAVVQASFSPDGDRLLTVCGDRNVRLWDPATGRLLTPPMLHLGYVHRARWSPDGSRIVTSVLVSDSGDFSAPVWDAHSGLPATPPLGNPDQLHDARFSPDGSRIVTAAHVHGADIWDARSGQRALPTLQHPRFVNAAVFSPDGLWVATGDGSGVTRVWDARQGQLAAEFPLQSQRITTLEFSPDSRRILAASVDGTVQVWSLPRETRPLSELHEWARFLSARHVDASGRLAPVDLAAILRERATTRRP